MSTHRDGYSEAPILLTALSDLLIFLALGDHITRGLKWIAVLS
jgi:hypothetical protein